MTKKEAIETIKNGHLAEGLLAFAMYNGAESISLKQRPWEYKVDEHWEIACNGQKIEVDGIPPLSWYIKFNGWPAGVMDVLGDGFLCAGEAGNEDNLRKALLNNINEAVTESK